MPYTYFRYRNILGDIYKTAACNVEVVERHKNAYTYVYCVCLHNCGLLSHFKMIFFFMYVCTYLDIFRRHMYHVRIIIAAAHSSQSGGGGAQVL